MGLGGRMALTVAVVAALAASAVGALSYTAAGSRLVDDADASLQRVAADLLDAGVGAGALAASVDAQPVILPPDPDTQVRVIGADGIVTIGGIAVGGVVANGAPGSATSVNLGFNQSDGAVITGQRDAALDTREPPNTDTRWRVLTVSVGDGALQVGQSLAGVDNALTDIGRATFMMVIIVAFSGAAVGWLVALGVTQRLRRLATAAELVATQDRLDVAIPLGGRDETGRVGRSFDHMLTALANSRREQQRLVEDAGHELRTPLTSLRTNIEVLRRHQNLSPELQSRLLGDLDRDVTELAALVEEVVAVAANNHDPGDTQRVLLADLASNAADQVRRRRRRDVEVTADDTMVLANTAAVERAIGNLIDNAAKFDTGGHPIEVTVLGGTLTVADRGPGIAPDQLNRIFSRFHRADDARGLPGAGLGLSIVAKVAADHGGGTFARNRPGGGAEIGFTLPEA